jgi:hypothetical protein
MRQSALDVNWRPRECAVLEAYLADFSVLHSDSLLCPTWAAIRNESTQEGRLISSQPRPPIPSRGSQRYTDIRAPVLAIYAFETVRGLDGSPARVAAETRNQEKRDQAAAFEAGVPSARVVRLDNASHDVFIRSLPKAGGSPKPYIADSDSGAHLRCRGFVEAH